MSVQREQNTRNARKPLQGIKLQRETKDGDTKDANNVSLPPFELTSDVCDAENAAANCVNNVDAVGRADGHGAIRRVCHDFDHRTTASISRRREQGKHDNAYLDRENQKTCAAAKREEKQSRKGASGGNQGQLGCVWLHVVQRESTHVKLGQVQRRPWRVCSRSTVSFWRLDEEAKTTPG
jgi:hypothetical protein